MKKFCTLLAVLAAICAGTAQAQVMKKSTVRHDVKADGQTTTAIEAGENQTWWGYVGDATELSGTGINKNDTYHCAIYLTGQDDMTADKKIQAVRFSLVASHVIGVKVWIANRLPTATPSADNTLWVQSVAKDDLGENIDVALDTPLDIPAEGLYVGYSFTITSASTESDQYPILVGGNDHPYGLLVRTNTAIPNWSTLYGQGFGSLSIKVLMEGQFAERAVVPSFATENHFVEKGKQTDVDLMLTNNGQSAVSNISYTIDDGQEQTVSLSKALKPFATDYVTISVAADATAQSSTKTLTVTRVNGEANQSVSPSAQFTLNTLDQFIQRNVVVEEFTGTACGFCPRGMVGMEKLREKFGDRFVGIAIHQYNETDAMYIANYASLGFSGAPSCIIDRTMMTDPYYGDSGDICNEFSWAMEVPATVAVDVVGIIDEAETEVAVTASVTSLFDTSDLRIEYVLVGDGLSGSTNAWTQSNNYATSAVAEEDLKIFARGGKYGQSNVIGYVFNDVALAWAGSSDVEPLGKLTGGQTRKVSHTLKLPTKATMRNALRKGTIHAVALIINADGTIANAVKKQVVDATGISSVTTDAPTATTQRYSIDGRQLLAPQRGLNVVRMSDGSVRKVVVK